MAKIIGQTRLMSKIASFSKQTLPKTLLLVGPSGCGKHTVAKHIAEKFDLDYVVLDTKVTGEDIRDYLHKTIDTLYVIDLKAFFEKDQNVFLKFIEEPSKTVYTILLADSEAGILPTILNRCIKYYFEDYTRAELEQILNVALPEQAFDIFNTPGKLLNLTASSFNDLLALGEKVIDKISQVSYGNALIIATRINYKDLYSKVDFNLFFDVVEYLALQDFKNNKNMQSLTIFKITNKYKQYANQTTLIKEALMFNYLTTLWEAVQYDVIRA